MKKIIAFAGTSSKASINKQLVEYTGSLLEKAHVSILDLNDFELPLFSVDVEKENGIPDTAQIFLAKIKSADGLIISLAEHNGAYSAVFKNIFDWISRIESKIFYGKPMLLMATSTGGRGGSSVLAIAKDRFPRHDANIIEVFSLPSFGNNFSEGKIVDHELNSQLKNSVKKFEQSL